MVTGPGTGKTHVAAEYRAVQGEDRNITSNKALCSRLRLIWGCSTWHPGCAAYGSATQRPEAVLNAKKKKSRPVRGNFKRARGQYMSSPRCSQLFNHESLAPNWSQHITI